MYIPIAQLKRKEGRYIPIAQLRGEVKPEIDLSGIDFGTDIFGTAQTTPLTYEGPTPQDLLKVAGQGIARQWAATGAKIAQKTKLATDDKVDPKTFFGISPNARALGVAIFGKEEPFNATDEDIEIMETFGADPEVTKKFGGSLTILLSVLDFTGATPFKGVVGFTRAMKAADNFADAAKAMKAVGFADDIVEAYAPVFVKARTTKEVKFALDAATALQSKTTGKGYRSVADLAKEAGEVAPRVIDEALQPLAQEARNAEKVLRRTYLEAIEEGKTPSQIVGLRKAGLQEAQFTETGRGVSGVLSPEERIALFNKTKNEFNQEIAKAKELGFENIKSYNRAQRMLEGEAIPITVENLKGLAPIIKKQAQALKEDNFIALKEVKSQLTDFYNQAVRGVRKTLPKIPKARQIPQVTFKQLDDLAEKIKAKDITGEKFAEVHAELAILSETIENMPGKELVKYVSKTTGQLPEITGKPTMKSLTGSGKIVPNSEFGRRGDDIIQSVFGYKKTYEEAVGESEAQKAVDDYIRMHGRINELSASATEMRKTLSAVRKGERLMELTKGDRRMAYRAVRDAFDLNETDLAKIRQGKDIMAMEKDEFGQFINDAEKMAETMAKTREAQAGLEFTIQEKQLNKWENVREAMNLPPVSKMTPEQFDQLNEVLMQYKTGDEFLPVRQLETIDRTELIGLKTVREVQEHLAEKYNLTPDQLPGIKPHPWMYDAQLARQHPLYDLLIDKYNVSYLNATSRIIELEKENTFLLKAARQSREAGIAEKLAPTDKRIIEWIEASPEAREALAKEMNPAELKAGQRMDEVFREYYDWLVKRSTENKFSSRFEDKYFPHVRRGFLEAWKEDGFLKGLKEQFDQFKQEERMLTILDQKTGDILPYEKWVGFTQFRTGGLIPTQNAARSFKTYVTALEKARQFDEFIPEIMIYVHSLSPKGLTARGVELDDSLKRFIKTWINSKKGRVQQQIVKPGSKMDWTLRMGVSLMRIRDLGLNIPVGIANIFGEQAGNLTMLGTKNYSIGAGRLLTPKGRAITKQYENFVGRTLWDKLTEASNTAGDQLLGGIFGLFGAASRRGNQIFLLGSMTTDEFAQGAISVERLAQLRKGMGKYRVVEGAESVFGKSAEAAVGGQYKKWAIPILVSTKDNSIKLAQIIRTRGIKAGLSSEEGAELFYSVLLGSAVGLGVMGYYQELKEDKDRNLVEDIIFKSMRDTMSMIGALDPKFLGSFAAPRLASFIVDLGEAIDNLLFLERYKTGELKGAKQLKETLTPLVVKQLLKEVEEEKSPQGGGSSMEAALKQFGLPPLPELNKLPKLPTLPKL